MSERKFLGIVEVDSGTIVIGDPAYLLPRKETGKPGVDYQHVVDADSELDVVRFAGGLTLLVNTKSDGPFPVYGEFDEEGLVAVSVLLDPLEI